MYTEEKEKKLIGQSKELLKLTEDGVHEKKEARQHAETLSEVLNYHDWRYYVKNDPVLADEEYDRLFKLLQKIEKNWPDLKTPDSPTQRVAKGLTKAFPEVKHLKPMLSLDNSYNKEDLKDFDRRVKELTGLEKVDYAVDPKYDGAGISVIYEDDVFVRGATRGNGVTGDDITNNLKLLRTIPLSANFSQYGIRKVEIRGEVLIHKDTFKKINKKRVEAGEAPFANPRNAAAGSLRLQDAQIVSERGLEAFLYHISYAEDMEGNNALSDTFSHHNKNIETLYRLGCKAPHNETKAFNNINEVLDYCKAWEEKRDELNYEVDGMVIKVNDLRLYDKLGVTSHHPRWAMAYKFKAKQKTSKIVDVIFNVGRTGTVTPVAKLEPVQVGGVTVSSASMFNEDFVKEKDIRKGDTVLVERAGDVIPYIVKPIKEAREGDEVKIDWPHQCPSCGSDLKRAESESAWRCPNINCPAQSKERLIHYVSKSAMDIEGLGEQLVERFFELGYLKQIPDIYRLDYDKIRALEGFEEKSVQNLKEAIEESKTRPVHRLLYALGVLHVGDTTAKMLAEKITCIRDLEDWSQDKLNGLHDIGPIVAKSIYDFFHHEQNLQMLEDLEKLGVKVCKTKEEEEQSGELEGQTFVFTGGLDHFSRSEAKEKVEQLGARVTSSMSKKVNYLIVGEDPGSKLKKAQNLETVKILNEDEFLALVGEQE